MSGDKPKSLAGWKSKEGLRFSLLSGTDEVWAMQAPAPPLTQQQ